MQTEDQDAAATRVTTMSRGHNRANEYTSLNGQSAYDHDDDGNLLDGGTYTFGCDFAKHLVKVTRKSESAVIGQYTYNALGRPLADPGFLARLERLLARSLLARRPGRKRKKVSR